MNEVSAFTEGSSLKVNNQKKLRKMYFVQVSPLLPRAGGYRPVVAATVATEVAEQR